MTGGRPPQLDGCLRRAAAALLAGPALGDVCGCCGLELKLDDPDSVCSGCYDDHGPLPPYAPALTA